MAPDSVIFTVAGMSRDHCRAAVTSEVAKVAGVQSVEVRDREELPAPASENACHA